MASRTLIVSVIVCLSISSANIINIQLLVDGGHQVGGKDSRSLPEGAAASYQSMSMCGYSKVDDDRLRNMENI